MSSEGVAAELHDLNFVPETLSFQNTLELGGPDSYSRTGVLVAPRGGGSYLRWAFRSECHSPG